jgi:hypothetical protein
MKKVEINLNSLISELTKEKARSYWSRAVKSDAIDMIERVLSDSDNVVNGVFSGSLSEFLASCVNHVGIVTDKIESVYSCMPYIKEASHGGNWLIYNDDIAEHYCTPSELKKVTHKDGTIRDHANTREDWLDVQARAHYQALRRIMWGVIAF